MPASPNAGDIFFAPTVRRSIARGEAQRNPWNRAVEIERVEPQRGDGHRRPDRALRQDEMDGPRFQGFHPWLLTSAPLVRKKCDLSFRWLPSGAGIPAASGRTPASPGSPRAAALRIGMPLMAFRTAISESLPLIVRGKSGASSRYRGTCLAEQCRAKLVLNGSRQFRCENLVGPHFHEEYDLLVAIAAAGRCQRLGDGPEMFRLADRFPTVPIRTPPGLSVASDASLNHDATTPGFPPPNRRGTKR